MTKQTLTMIRGDTFSFDLQLSDYNNEIVTSVKFTAKREATDDEFIFQESLENGGVTRLEEEGSFRVRVAPADTDGVEGGLYVYDLEIGLGNDIYTVLMGPLKIIQDVTTN